MLYMDFYGLVSCLNLYCLTVITLYKNNFNAVHGFLWFSFLSKFVLSYCYYSLFKTMHLNLLKIMCEWYFNGMCLRTAELKIHMYFMIRVS